MLLCWCLVRSPCSAEAGKVPAWLSWLCMVGSGHGPLSGGDSMRAVSQSGQAPAPALTWALACPGLAGRRWRPGLCPSCVTGPATRWTGAPRAQQLNVSGAERGVPAAGQGRPQRRLAPLGPSAGPPFSSGERRSVLAGPVLGRGCQAQPPPLPQALALAQLVPGPRAAQWSVRDRGLAEPFQAAL